VALLKLARKGIGETGRIAESRYGVKDCRAAAQLVGRPPTMQGKVREIKALLGPHGIETDQRRVAWACPNRKKPDDLCGQCRNQGAGICQSQPPCRAGG
jgi:hypothetical protein